MHLSLIHICGFLHYGRYRGITAGLEWGGIMLRGLLRLHILPGLCLLYTSLDYAQALYEKRLLTYPRTDSNYITSDMEQTAATFIIC